MGSVKPPLNTLEKSLIVVQRWFYASLFVSIVLISVVALMFATKLFGYLTGDNPTQKVQNEATYRLEQEGP